MTGRALVPGASACNALFGFAMRTGDLLGSLACIRPAFNREPLPASRAETGNDIGIIVHLALEQCLVPPETSEVSHGTLYKNGSI